MKKRKVVKRKENKNVNTAKGKRIRIRPMMMKAREESY